MRYCKYQRQTTGANEMNDYQLLEIQNEKHKDLIREAKRVRAARNAQAGQKVERKNSFVQFLTRG
jgi:hypothetical protein